MLFHKIFIKRLCPYTPMKQKSDFTLMKYNLDFIGQAGQAQSEIIKSNFTGQALTLFDLTQKSKQKKSRLHPSYSKNLRAKG